jgi:hypothetical protein
MTRVALVAGTALLLLVGAAQGAHRTAPSNVSPPTISGTASVGSTLSASPGAWSGSDPKTYSYQWQRCKANGNGCGKIAGAAGTTYQLVKKDAGHTIRVSVTANNADGSANATSSPTAVVSNGNPVNTSPPTISGTAKEGETLSATSGTWTGSGPISFTYEWRRCNASGNDCDSVSSGQTRVLNNGDVGHTMRIQVRAKNANGSTTANSAQTGAVAPKGPLPASSAPPVISGLAREGQVLTASPGTWANAPTSFQYTWRRCDANGNNCDGFAAGPQVKLTAADVGHRIRVVVEARNAYGSTRSTSVPTAVVVRAAPAAPTGAIKLPSGETSLPISMIAPPQRLVISGVRFTPARIVGRQAFVGRFRVTDTRGFVVRGALVYAVGLPYAWLRTAPEVVTGTDGWAQITFLPTRAMPLRRAALVLFLRARKPGDSLLAGVSSRRLVQIGIG